MSHEEVLELTNGVQALSMDSPVIDAVLGFCVGTARSESEASKTPLLMSSVSRG